MIKLHGIYKQNQPGSGLGCFGRHQLKLLGALPHCVLFLSDLVTSVVSISGNKLRGMLLHAKRHSLPVRTRKAPLRYLSTPKLKSRFHSGTGQDFSRDQPGFCWIHQRLLGCNLGKQRKRNYCLIKKAEKSLLFSCVVIDLQALIQAPY